MMSKKIITSVFVLGLGIVAMVILGSAHPSGAQGTPPVPPGTWDALKITDANGNLVVNWSDNTDTVEYFSKLQAGVMPQTFTAATVYLTEPADEIPLGSYLVTLGGQNVADKYYSDALSINGSFTNGLFNVFYISDQATNDQCANFPIFANQYVIPETGQWQDVSAYFGFPANSILIMSDVSTNEIPEPATFLLFGGGLVGLLTFMKRSKKA